MKQKNIALADCAEIGKINCHKTTDSRVLCHEVMKIVNADYKERQDTLIEFNLAGATKSSPKTIFIPGYHGDGIVYSAEMVIEQEGTGMQYWRIVRETYIVE